MGLAEGTGKGGMGSRLAPAASTGSTRSPARPATRSRRGRPRVKPGAAVCGGCSADQRNITSHLDCRKELDNLFQELLLTVAVQLIDDILHGFFVKVSIKKISTRKFFRSFIGADMIHFSAGKRKNMPCHR